MSGRNSANFSDVPLDCTTGRKNRPVEYVNWLHQPSTDRLAHTLDCHTTLQRHAERNDSRQHCRPVFEAAEGSCARAATPIVHKAMDLHII
jgi:hypothetical protein